MKFCCRAFAHAVRDGAIQIGNEDFDTLSKRDVETAVLLSEDSRWYMVNYCPFCGKKITFEFEEDDNHEQ